MQTPTNWRQRSRTDRLFFTVELVLPSAAAPLYINALSTDVSNFSHDLDPLMGIIKFGAVALKGSNGHIDIKVLAAPSAMVRSSNGGISGTFNTSALLDLRTSNGAIAAAVGVDGSTSTSAHPARVMLRTSNNALQSTLDLHTSTNSGGVFALTADTSNGRLDTHIASLPADSTLRAAARTSNARALLALPRAFEGAFSAQTSNAQPSVQRGEEEPDPAGRRRVVETQMVGKREVRGNVYWERGNRARGEASVRTSNGGVTIIL
ncbi:hypothetical protein B0H10DRAFT_1772769 [Mycena sp. CBHHK59/15]|nr:hypothetical protein B0H10DRAFT_1772769 [Mycena sp. CBHHK59/15]